MLRYCLLLNAATTTLLFSLASFFTTIEHNVLQAQQTDIDQTFEVVTEENDVEAEIKNDRALNLSNKQLITSEDVLIINLTGKPISLQNQKLTVSGIVRPFIKEEFEQDYNLTWDLETQQQLEKEYSQKPVLVVNSIFPSSQQ